MESKEVYKRQVLSISCITIGISLLGTLCMALYCQNKRRREKLQAHLKVSCSLKNPNVGFAPALTSKSSLRLQYGLQFQKHCKEFSPPHGGAVCGSNSCPAPPAHPKAPTTRKQSRSSSLSNSAGQRNRASHYLTAPRRTPPISRERLNPISGSRDSSHAYQHLQEVEGSEIEVRSSKRCTCSTVGTDPRQVEHFDVQQGERGEDRWGHTGMQFSHQDQATPLHRAPAPSLRTCSVPIIPSFQGHDVTSCMQKNTLGRETRSPEGGASPQETCPPRPPQQGPVAHRGTGRRNQETDSGPCPRPKGSRRTRLAASCYLPGAELREKPKRSS
ncbi:hypothetical protein AAFF_G00271530 [Aldrovandia affinis]|uniref:Uncharacterized protein n=1 Tax=Aldrovandia affinis TaxID=143900 RepID=A0AAD7W2D1_9TELE|nr:hypothetical protein AAFF_G00271530 [Aldrovandia affinis]